MIRIFSKFPIRYFLSHEKIRNTAKVPAFQSLVKQLYVTVKHNLPRDKHVG